MCSNRNYRQDGTVVDCEWHNSALYDENGKLTSILSQVLDISERRRAETASLAAKAEADQANNAKSRFLAAASHDLRQPLAALSLYVNILKNKVAPADKKLVTQLTECVDSLSGLLTDLLDLSKLDAGVVTPKVSDFSIAETLASLVSIHTPEAGLKGLQLRCRPTRLTGRTDPVLFQRILGNLIQNALRYTERGGVLVACRQRRGKTWVEVYDTGIGIPADQTAAIFEEFRQLGDQARNSGSGLGLAIVAKTAALLGLEVRVRSRPGSGSVFAIELPLGQPTATRPALRPVEVMPLRIALVEDNSLVRDALTESLQMLGHQVVAAASQGALLAELDGLPPDVVISDYRLARGETGFDVITALRARFGAELPAILITGDTAPALLRSMTKRGINVLHKPIELDALQACLEVLMCEVT
jgi:signal transduction histidine kinase/CheY-like chemotaxis protein